MKVTINDIVVIIPVHKMANDVKELLPKAINSVPAGMEIRVSCVHGLSDDLKGVIGKKKGVFIYEDENADAPNSFQRLVNQATGDTKWFSILEYDDTFNTDVWAKNVVEYINEMPDVSVLMCFEDLVNSSDGKFIGMGNDAPWASSFSDEMGYLDVDSLMAYYDFYLTGSLFNTNDWNVVGGLKESMKLTFWYEFLLRAIHNGKKVYIMPKVGYTHMLGRKGSLIEIYKAELDEKEADWWFELARKEYFFKEDRKKQYAAEKKGE